MCSLIEKVNAGSCVAERRPKSTRLLAPPGSKRSTWKSISGECSRFPSHAVGVKRSKALVVSAGLSVLFLFVYGGFNRITSPPRDAGPLFFFWGRQKPFFSLFFFSFLSIHLFFFFFSFLF